MSKVPTEFQYIEKHVFMKEVTTQKFWTFELGTPEVFKISIKIFVGFQQRNEQDSEKLNIDTFFGPPVTSAQCIIGTEKLLDSGTLLNFDDDEYSQAYG